MTVFTWIDLALFILLFASFVYVFAAVEITSLHKVYFMFHFLMMLWPLCQFAADISSNPRNQLFYVTASFTALSLLGGGWLLLTMFLTGHADKLKIKNIGLLFIPAVITAIGVIVNPFRSFVKPLQGGYVHRTYGPWFWFMVVISLSYFLVSLYFIYRSIYSSKTVPTVKKQVKLTLAGIGVLTLFALSDLMVNVVFKPRLPIIPGLTSDGIFFSDIFFVIAMIRYKVFDIVTIANKDVIDTIPYGILVLDEKEVIIEVNPALQAYTDLHVGDRFHMEGFLETVRTDGSLRTFLKDYSERGHKPSQIEIILESPEPIHLVLQTAPVMINHTSRIGRILTFQDVTQLRRLVDEMNQQNEVLQERNLALVGTRDELRRANQMLAEMAHTDSLTKCYNRHYLMQQLTHEVMTNVRYDIPFALILFDFDYFKAINDSYGHLVGDEVLRSTVDKVKRSLRQTDILARFGGEEFMIYLPHTSRHQAIRLAERIKLAVESNPIVPEHGKPPISVTISLGVLPVKEAGTEHVFSNPEGYLIELFAAVDKALYRAKQNGRNLIEYA